MTRDEAIAAQRRLFPRLIWTLADPNCSAGVRFDHTPTLPEICLDLRASCNGKADPWPTKSLRQVVDMLEARFETWQSSTDSMDYHVRSMIWCAMHLGREELAKRAKVEAERRPKP